MLGIWLPVLTRDAAILSSSADVTPLPERSDHCLRYISDPIKSQNSYLDVRAPNSLIDCGLGHYFNIGIALNHCFSYT